MCTVLAVYVLVLFVCLHAVVVRQLLRNFCNERRSSALTHQNNGCGPRAFCVHSGELGKLLVHRLRSLVLFLVLRLCLDLLLLAGNVVCFSLFICLL